MKIKLVLAAILALVIFGVGNIQAQTSGFTYQGQFEDSSVSQPTNGTYDMEFALFDSETNGTQIGSTQTVNAIQVVNGVFSVSLTFGNSALDGSTRFLEIRVLDNNTSTFVALSPRTQINSAPYAFQASQSTIAKNTNNVGMKTTAEVVSATDEVQTADSNNVANKLVKRGNNGEIDIGNMTINGVPITGGVNFLNLGDSSVTLNLGRIASGGGTDLCTNLLAVARLAFCSSSLRYKKDISPFSSGMSIINRLEPISYTWKTDGTKDTGFGAEDVAKINPLFVTYNQKGEVEGVKYKRLSVLFVNAFKEQQAEIETLKKENQNIQTQLNKLEKLVCLTNDEAAICREDQ